MLQNRTSKLLSGKDVINLRNSSLKDIPSGCKEYAPNNSWLERKQIQVTLETHHSLVGSERIEKKASLSTAIWFSNVGKAKVTKKAGKIWEVFGHTVDSEDWLLPEEALFLLETNALELFREDIPLSVEETYTLIVGHHCSLDEYRVYSHLSRKGYKVLRHDKEITLTAYEKNIHLDQINLAAKRCAPTTSIAVATVNDGVREDEGGDSTTERYVPTIPIAVATVNDGVREDEGGDSTTERYVPTIPIAVATVNDEVREDEGGDSTTERYVPTIPIAVATVNDGVREDEGGDSTTERYVPTIPIAVTTVNDEVREDEGGDSTTERCAPTTSIAVTTVNGEVREDEDGDSKTGRAAENISATSAATAIMEVESTLAEEVTKPQICTEIGPKGKKSTAGLSVAGTAKGVESTGEVEGESISTEEESILAEETKQCLLHADNGSKSGKSLVENTANDLDATCVPRVKLVSTEQKEQSPICIEDEPEVVEGSTNDSTVEDKTEDIESTLEASCDIVPAVVVDISLVHTSEKESSSVVAMQDGNNLTVSAILPLKKRVGSSPDLYIVEDEGDDIIEIDDDEELHDAHDVEITDVINASHMDTVDLMDSEEDDDVVFICQKDGNTDPTKWRKWFLTIPAFVNTTFPEEIDPSFQTPPKLKLIDLFDLGNKTTDTIMKAIPSHDGSAGFINAPDLRFIPQNIVPKFAHYRINVQTYDSAVEGSDTHSVQSHLPSTPVGHVDTSQSLSQLVQYGQESDSFSRNPYGYSFHRTRYNNYRRNPWNHQQNYQNRNNQFQRQQSQSFRPNRFNSSDQNQDSQSPIVSNDAPNQNDFSSTGNHDNQKRNYYSSNGLHNYSRPNNFRGSNQNNFQNSFGNNLNSAPMGGFQQNPNQFEGQLKHALQQACRMQMLAMSLMQNSQVLIENFGAPSMFSNPMNFNTGSNFNPLNNFNLANNFNPMNNFNSMNISNPFTNQFNGDYRGRRPYRRPYMKRGYAGRRRYYNNERDSTQVPDVPEVVCIDLDEEDHEVKPNKRLLALGAIANLNSNKRAKIIKISEVEDVKPERVVKNEYQPSSSKLNVESTLVKDERLPSKTEPMDLASVCKSEKATSAISVSPDVDDCKVGPVIISEVLDRPSRSLVPMAARRSNSPMEIVDDDGSDTGSVIEVSSTNEPLGLDVPDDEGLEPDSVMEKDGNEESSTKAEEMVTASDGVSVATVKEALPGSWQSYKQGLTEPNADAPRQVKTFSTLLNFDDQRAGVQDVLKSLQIFDTFDETETTATRIKVSFDVYLPNQPFKKSVRLLPNYRVIVTGSLCFPSVYELNYLKETYRDDVPFLYAVVYDDSIGLYNLHSVSLPTLAENV